MIIPNSKDLHHGGHLDPVRFNSLANQVGEALLVARHAKVFSWDQEAADYWTVVYPTFKKGREGLFGAMSGRSSGHAVRLALTYALLGGSLNPIRLPHLKGGLAIVQFCENSIRHLFGDASVFKADNTIIQALRKERPKGLTLSQIHKLFHNNKEGEELNRSLKHLTDQGMIYDVTTKTEGKDVTTYYAG